MNLTANTTVLSSSVWPLLFCISLCCPKWASSIALNGFGYLALLGAYFLPIPFFQQRHRLVWWALAGYTLLTFVLWIILGDKQFVAGTPSAIGYYAKAAEVILLAFLWADKP
jgi:hypothetical protein